MEEPYYNRHHCDPEHHNLEINTDRQELSFQRMAQDSRSNPATLGASITGVDVLLTPLTLFGLSGLEFLMNL
jgi:hypothetical protein